MRRHQSLKSLYYFCLSLALLSLTTLSAQAAELTQRDWMVSLVDAAGWSFGLPDEPQDPDYINILNGNRDLRFEAEDIYAVDKDNVSLMSFRNFGEFSGKGWLNGSRQATDVHLSFTLPVDGTYQLEAHLRRKGHKLNFNGQEIALDAEEAFTKVDVGSFQLQAGPQEIIVTLPPGGSIDYISLKAANLGAITPAEGWQPDEVLNWEVVQTTMLQTMRLAEVFSADPSVLHYEAEKLKGTEAKVVDIPHLGVPSKGEWLRAGPKPEEVSFPLNLGKSGFYDLAVRVMGNPVTITVGGHQTIQLEAKSYLDDYSFKALYLFAGTSSIKVTIPPGGGVDWLSLTARQVKPAATMTLLGLDPSAKPSPREIDRLASLVATFGANR